MSRVLRRLVGDYEENSGLEEARAMRQRQVWGQKQRPQPRVSHVLVLIFSLEQEHLGRKGSGLPKVELALLLSEK